LISSCLYRLADIRLNHPCAGGMGRHVYVDYPENCLFLWGSALMDGECKNGRTDQDDVPLVLTSGFPHMLSTGVPAAEA